MTENERKTSLLRPSLLVSGVTLLSRLLGILRVRLEASVLGGGELASAWFLAFAIPNLFRRLLGEGALGTALIPLIAGIEQEKGKENMRRELAVVFTALSILLAVIVVAVGAGSIGLRYFSRCYGITFFCTPRMDMALQLLPLLMPYAFFMCLVGVATAVLNYVKVFVLPACGALLLNIFLISGLTFGYLHGVGIDNLPSFLPVLSILVLVSGLTQLILTLLLLFFYGYFPKLDFDVFKKSDVLAKLWQLSLPGVIAASVLQVSFLVDRMLAVKLNSQAVPALTFVDRLVDLPIGLFAVSLGSVLMASMARAAAKNDFAQLKDELEFSLRHVYFVCIPMAAAVIVFHVPLLRVLCLGGNYTESDLEAARSVAIFYSAGIPLFCSLKILLPAFYARKEMRKPLIASVTAICLNIVLNLILMGPLKQGGIALATTISSLVNNAILFCFLRQDKVMPDMKVLLYSALRGIVIAFSVMFILSKIYALFEEALIANRWIYALSVIILLMFAGVFYLAAAWICRSPECTELFSVVKKRTNRKS